MLSGTGQAGRLAGTRGGKLGGTWGTVLLPIGADDTIDFGALNEELSVLASAGLAGVYTCGTAGEFYTLDEAEFDRLSQLVANRFSEAGVPFQIGASHMSAQVCLSRIERARALQPRAIQVILPDWLPLSRAEAKATLERMAQAADPVPLVLYNPPHAKTVLRASDIAELAATIPTLAGVKVAGSEDFYRALHDAVPRLALFVPGHELGRARPLGAAGSYSNIACLRPAGAVAWERWMETEPVRADELGERVIAFFDRHIGPLKAQGYCNTALDKTLAAIGAWAPIGTRTRWPYDTIPDEVVEILKPLARAALPELFEAN